MGKTGTEQKEVRYLTLQDAAKYISMSASYLYKNKGDEIPFIQKGAKILFDVEDLDEWMKKDKVATKQQVIDAAAA